MNDIKRIFKKDFIINTNIVKTISNLDITIKEFMLLLYFININNSLDLKNIKDKIDLMMKIYLILIVVY